MSGMELTAVFTRHKDSKDANAALEYIEPDSIVFNEGHMIMPFYARKRAYQMLELAASRLIDGYYSEDSMTKADSLVEKFVNPDPTISAATHQSFSYTLTKGIYEKNCVYLPADYIEFGNTPSTIKYRLTSRHEQKVFKDFAHEPTVEKISTLVEIEMNRAKYLTETAEIREAAAINRVREVTSALGSNVFKNIALNDHNQPKAYIIYGDSHWQSLSEAFRHANIPVARTIRVHDLGDYPDVTTMREDLKSNQFEHKATHHYLQIVQKSLAQKAVSYSV